MEIGTHESDADLCLAGLPCDSCRAIALIEIRRFCTSLGVVSEMCAGSGLVVQRDRPPRRARHALSTRLGRDRPALFMLPGFPSILELNGSDVAWSEVSPIEVPCFEHRAAALALVAGAGSCRSRAASPPRAPSS